MRPPEIENSTEEERREYIKNTFRCIADCDMCGYARCFVEKIRKLPMQIISTVSGFIWMYQRIIDNETAKTRNILNVFEYFCR